MKMYWFFSCKVSARNYILLQYSKTSIIVNIIVVATIIHFGYNDVKSFFYSNISLLHGRYNFIRPNATKSALLHSCFNVLLSGVKGFLWHCRYEKGLVLRRKLGQTILYTRKKIGITRFLRKKKAKKYLE